MDESKASAIKMSCRYEGTFAIKPTVARALPAASGNKRLFDLSIVYDGVEVMRYTNIQLAPSWYTRLWMWFRRVVLRRPIDGDFHHSLVVTNSDNAKE